MGAARGARQIQLDKYLGKATKWPFHPSDWLYPQGQEGGRVSSIESGGGVRTRKFVAVGFLFAALARSQPIRAQQDPATLELYGGYEYVRVNVTTNVAGQPRRRRSMGMEAMVNWFTT
jgi:hypothetical protein